jgi:hypothetical protein
MIESYNRKAAQLSQLKMNPELAKADMQIAKYSFTHMDDNSLIA